MIHISKNNVTKFAITMVRVLIGWHFLYEGLYKLAASGTRVNAVASPIGKPATMRPGAYQAKAMDKYGN